MKFSDVLARTTALVGASLLGSAALAADAQLWGAIKGPDGARMGGVTVSAKAQGSTITTTVFTDENGDYFFPPMTTGKYEVWAQAIKFETARASVDLSANRAQDFAMKSFADWYVQLPGDEMLNALPAGTNDEKRLKNIVRKNCTGCHTASYPLQHRFDEAGWFAVLNLMKRVNVLGTYVPDREINGTIETHQRELAQYLAKARGPGETSMKFNLRPRPSGETARVVFREYDVPVGEDEGLPYKYLPHNGSDWMLGTPSGMNGANGVHDAELDLDGHIWWTQAHPTHTETVARTDAKTGETKVFTMKEPNGYASNSHGIIRDPQGYLWFNSRPSANRGLRQGLVKIDPKTLTLTKYVPPEGMSYTAGSLDWDGKGQIWVTSPDGALRFDPVSEKFREFKSVAYKNELGLDPVYGVAADRDGNGWWAGMRYDKINKGDIGSGKTTEIKLPPDAKELQWLTSDEKNFYATFAPPDFNTPVPWAQGPRRMGTDKKDDVLWVANSFGGNYARIDTKTSEVKLIEMPNPEVQQPYHVVVDNAKAAWTNLWSTDQIAKYDPVAARWTLYDLPTRGTETRYIGLLEKPGQPLQVVIPYSRLRKIAIMSPRSESDLAQLKSSAR
mgnify:CR=1 FL=1